MQPDGLVGKTSPVLDGQGRKSLPSGTGASMTEILPAVFFGHGNPMNALQRQCLHRRRGGASARRLPRPRAILSISAHWFVPGTGVTVSTAPRTIHDFGGFPRELYQVQYPAPGDPAARGRVQALLAPVAGRRSTTRGASTTARGRCSTHVYPAADVPVVQLSIDETQPPAFHFEIGRRLAPLRDEGVLIVGSGNLVHNLHAYAWGRHAPDPYDWAVRFEAEARGLLSPAITRRSWTTSRSAATRCCRFRRRTTTCRCCT